MPTTYKAMQDAARLQRLRRDLALDFEIPAKDLLQNAALDLGISLKTLDKRLANARAEDES